MRVRTKTSRFGVSRRESHDSTAFYRSRLYGGCRAAERGPEVENSLGPDLVDRILCQDSRDLSNLPDSSVHLMVTSPPYNVSKEYDEDFSLGEYLELLGSVFAETSRVLVNGGRACVNVANVGRRPYIPYHKYVMDAMLDLGFLMRGEIIWQKGARGAAAGTSTAWGSWRSASNPTLRDTHEYILVFSKGKFSRTGQGRESTISREEFLEFTRSVWEFPPESANRVGHPAPFPEELPRRLIHLYSFRGDVVLDPFVGVGTTCVAALRAGRHFVGVDNNPDYVALALRRLEAVRGGEAQAS
jgi:site-specific DNA-methyltransferase (adenine-specific)